MPGSRVSSSESERRTVEAAGLLQSGRSAASVVSELARVWGCSERQASRYVAAAKRRLSWAIAGDSLAQPLHQGISAVMDLAVRAQEAGELREANKAWATFATLLKSASRLDSYNVWEVHREAVGASDPAPFPPEPGPDDDSPPF